MYVYITVGSLLWGKKLDTGDVSAKFTPLPRAAPTATAQSYGSMGFAAPGTFVLAMVFLVAFVLYYFINWKYLSTLVGAQLTSSGPWGMMRNLPWTPP